MCVCVWGGVNKGDFCRVSDGQSVMEGERDLINQVNPFLRSLVVSVEMQFEKGFRRPVLNKVYLESGGGCSTSFQHLFFFLFPSLSSLPGL